MHISGDRRRRFSPLRLFDRNTALARTFFKIACQGNHSNGTWKKIEEFLDEWDAFYKAEVQDYDSQDEVSSTSSGDVNFHDI